MKEQLIKEFNKVGINDMSGVNEHFDVKGSFVNLDLSKPEKRGKVQTKSEELAIKTQ